ncbi:ribosomal RNA-processing protein [Medicago truncatula]|uniref:Ribosomal RNA-processing protein n=1 Tax=Medicago truncatula TaxID=3880 RepID=A0A072UK54_MEDTR|nr:ribosomal RNA-processing protein [Medicago truncatula]
MAKVSKGKKVIRIGEKKKKSNMEQNADVETHVTVNNDVDNGMQLIKGKKAKVITIRERKNKDKNLVGREKPEVVDVVVEEKNVDHGMQVTEGKKVKATTSRKRKNKDKNLVGRQTPEDEVDFEEKNDGVVEHSDSKEEEVKDSKKHRDSNVEAAIKPCKSKQAKKKRRKEVIKSPEKREQNHQDDIHIISSGDDDCSHGIKKWIMEYHQNRPGLEVLQNQIEDFLTTYEEKLEEERKAKEALAAEGGWTVVQHHKGRKKTTDSESGIAVGSVAQAALENKLAKKKNKEVGQDFYRFQKREAQRNELMELQSKFEEDKKRLQQLRAARKFRPY